MSKELKAETIVPQGTAITLQMYPKSEVDAVLAEKDAEIAQLQAMLEERNKQVGEPTEKLENVNKLVKESKELLYESQKMHKRCADNASKEIRRLKRALYKACANWAYYVDAFINEGMALDNRRWIDMYDKCRAMAQKFGG